MDYQGLRSVFHAKAWLVQGYAVWWKYCYELYHQGFRSVYHAKSHDEYRGVQYGRSTVMKCTGELGYDGPLYDGFLHMTDDMLCPSPMHIKDLSYVYDRFCI